MQPTVAELDASDRAAFVAVLGGLFEHSPWVAEEAYEKRPFRDADRLYSALCATMMAAPQDMQLALVRAHPDLAGRMAAAGKLTAESTKEQAAAGLNALTPAEASEIQSLNQAYKDRFSFPFVICARLNAKDTILAAMRSRLKNDSNAELSTALAEIAKIARLRLNEAVSNPS